MKNMTNKMNKSIVFVSGMLLVMCLVLMMGATYVGVKKGEVYLAYVEYSDSDTITVTSGYGECNGSRFELTSTTSHDMTSLATAEDFHYIYIDDSASSYPTPTIIDSTTEPSWSDSKLGYYNGNDRCIGVVWSSDSGATVAEFVNNSSQKYCGAFEALLETGNPTWEWQTLEATAYIPVNAVAVRLHVSGADFVNGNVLVSVKTYEDSNGVISKNRYTEQRVDETAWFELERGASRDLQWKGNDDDSNFFFISRFGYQIER
jgi:hypothetical protein